ncbi:MAG: TonB-dependent siderophore receptor [Rhizobiales bacterium PAR1]|nr:MAG: TonB-dependent siderophore receptor [Rhizobiales bacterium PAR1]
MSFVSVRPFRTAVSSVALLIALGATGALAQQAAPLPELRVEGQRAAPARPQARRPTRVQPRAVAPRPAAVATPAPAVPLVGGRAIEKTTAGPVRGYQAITSLSATKTDLPIQNTPQSVMVLPRKVLEDQGAQTISEALTNVSGVLPLNPLTFGQLNPKIRGFAAERVVDGLPNYYDAGARDLTVNVERLEVLKGPQGVLFSGGANATSGVVNTVSKLPTATRFAEFGLTGGSFRTISPYFDINQPLNKDGTVLFRMTGQYEHAHSFIDVLTRQNFTLNPTLVLTNNSGTTLTLQGHYSKREQQDYSGLPTIGTLDRSAFSIRRHLFPGSPDVPRTKSDLASLTAKLDHEFNSTWSSSTVLRVGQSKYYEPSQGLTSNTPSAGSSFDVYNIKIDQTTKEISFNETLKARFDTGPAKHTALFAVDYNRVTDNGKMFGDFVGTPTNYLTGPFPAYSETGPFWGTYIDARNRYSVMGATAQVQSSLYDRFHLVAGGRLARIQVSDNDLTGTRAFLTGGSNLAKTDTTKFLPRIGAAFDVTKSITLFAGYSEGMRPVPYLLSLAPMKPELSKQAEAGIKLNTDFGLSATLAAFEVRRKNVPVADPATFGFTSIQSSEQRSRGFEADVIYQPNANWSFLANYAYTDTEVKKDTTAANVGQPLPGVPRNTGRLWANYLVTSGVAKGLSFGAGVYAASGQMVELGRTWRTQAYATIDAKIAYEYDNWKFSIVGKNLTNTKYFTRYEYFAGRVVPGAPTSVYATISKKF